MVDSLSVALGAVMRSDPNNTVQFNQQFFLTRRVASRRKAERTLKMPANFLVWGEDPGLVSDIGLCRPNSSPKHSSFQMVNKRSAGVTVLRVWPSQCLGDRAY